MTERETAAPTFVRGNDQIDRLAADPLLTADIETADTDVEEMGRIYAINHGRRIELDLSRLRAGYADQFVPTDIS